MLRRPLAFALAIALLPAAAQADDLLQSYNNARNSDPQYAAAESSRAVAAERPVQARSVLLPQVNGTVSWNRVGTTSSSWTSCGARCAPVTASSIASTSSPA